MHKGFRYTLALLVVLGLVWMLWSGMLKPLLIFLGALSVVAVAVVSRRMAIVDDEGAPIQIAPRLPFYLPWLLWQIVKANVDVALRIVSPGLPIRPSVVEVEAGQRTETGRVVYANSITLTPGTVSIGVDGKRFTVHALTEAAADDLRAGGMNRRVCSLEGHD